MTNTPADWTDAEIARWMAERDGYYVEGPERKRWVLKDKNGYVKPSRGAYRYTADSEAQAWSYAPPYPHSLDAAVAWLGRRGLEWRRTFDVDEGMYAMEALDSIIWRACYESPTCQTERALCNAGCAAEMAREAV